MKLRLVDRFNLKFNGHTGYGKYMSTGEAVNT